MKFYIASRFANKDRVLEMAGKLEELGHSWSFNWTRHQSIKPYSENKELAEQFGVDDFEGVLDADIFIILGDEAGSGMYVELGAAMASNALKGGVKIYSIGEYNERTPFHFHPMVKRLESFEEVLEDLGINP